LPVSRLYPLLALVNLLAGGFLIVATYGFGAKTTSEIGLEVSIVVMLLGVLMTYWSLGLREKVVALPLGIATTAVAVWTIIASTAFPDETAQWLVFASGCAHIGIAVVGIVVHEVIAPPARNQG
jgi:hypothetical protein